jgi:hypothetical protein
MDVAGFGANAIDQVIRLYRNPAADARAVCPPGRYGLFPNVLYELDVQFIRSRTPGEGKR